MRRHTITTLMMVLALVLLAACGARESSQPSGQQVPQGSADVEKGAQGEKLKVAFVYVGPIGDGGYTYAHDQGRKYLEKELGDKVETTYLESVPEGADAERVFEELAQKGYKVIFGTSFGYMDAMLNVAKRHPDVIFMHCSGFKTAPNMGTYFGRNHESWYLAGVVAGYSSPTGRTGFVAAHPIPEVVRAINAFTLGLRSVNPNATVKVVWTNTWYDPAKEKTAAESLLDVGADLLAMYQDTPATLQAAQERGKLAIGHNSDMRQYAPKAFVTAPIWNWGPYYVKAVKSVLDGSWKSEAYWGHMSDGIVDIAPVSDLAPAEAKQKAEEVKQKIIRGEFDVFQGPIKDQSGKERVPAGKKMSDEELLSFDWFVQGVEGTIPKT